MPVPEGTRFRFRQLKGGKKQRLAFSRSGDVIEAVTFDKAGEKTATHTPAEFRADTKRRGLRT